MTLRNELNKLTDSDIYSLILFALYKMNETNEYSSLSELSYLLDKESLLKLCEFYGGTTIRIPTINELEIKCRITLTQDEFSMDSNYIFIEVL